MRIIGFDIALTRSGAGVIDYRTGELVQTHELSTVPADSLLDRIEQIGNWACEVIDGHTQYEPVDVGLEEGIAYRSGKTTRYLAMAWAAVALAARQRGLDPAVVNNATVKVTADARTKAEAQVKAMERWSLPGSTSSDVTDALWVAETTRRELVQFIARQEVGS